MLDMGSDVDAHMRRVLAIHLDPVGGTPYWLDRQKELGIDIVSQVRTVDDLRKLPLADEDILRRKPLSYFIPKSVWNAERGKILFCESSGTTGPRKWIPWHSEFSDRVIDFYNFNLDRYGVPRDMNWVAFGPSGLFEKHCRDVAMSRGGHCFFLSFDPKHAKSLFMGGDKQKIIEFYRHIYEEMDYIAAREKIEGIITVPQMIELLPEVTNLRDLKVILFGGVGFHGEPDEYMTGLKSYGAMRDKFKKYIFQGWYGNAFWGPAFIYPDGTNNMNYYPFSPYVVFEVVNPEHPFEKVGYGQRGRVKFHRFTREFLWVNSLERDLANRIPPKEPYKCDGVQNIGPYKQEFEKSKV